MYNNWWSFGVYGKELEHYINYVDSSNTVDGKPVCYIMNCTQFKVNYDVGFIAIVNSSDGLVTDSKIKKSYQGILIAFSEKITLNNVDLSENFVGIFLMNSSNNIITECNVSENIFGFWFDNANFNRIYLNNFIKNGDFMSVQSFNYLDDGPTKGGNYWDNYSGTDSTFDGIGDSSYEAYSGNFDHYPLVGLIRKFKAIDQHYVLVVSNSTIDSFRYFDNETLRFDLSPKNDSYGFFRVRIPKELLGPENISVLIDNGAQNILFANFSIYEDDSYRWIYFSYSGASKKIEIIPEFSTIGCFVVCFFLMCFKFMSEKLSRYLRKNL